MISMVVASNVIKKAGNKSNISCFFLKDFIIFAPVFKSMETKFAEVAQLVEHQLPKLRVAGSSPVFRSSENQAVTTKVAAFFLYICRKHVRYWGLDTHAARGHRQVFVRTGRVKSK